jgi:superoxide dismutase, Cu-Zn family
MKVVFALAAAILLAAPAGAAAAATARLIDRDGKLAGRANFKAAPHGVLIELDVKGLTPGAHAVLLHAEASCDPAGGFATAGPILSFDPVRRHGYFAKGGGRSGDLPNQFADESGRLHASFFTTAVSLGNGKKSLFDGDGTAIVVHAKPDDYSAQPEGRAGARLFCGSVIRTAEPGRHKGTKNGR